MPFALPLFSELLSPLDKRTSAAVGVLKPQAEVLSVVPSVPRIQMGVREKVVYRLRQAESSVPIDDIAARAEYARSLRNEVWTSADMTDDQICQVAAFDRYVYSNSPDWECYVCVDCELRTGDLRRWTAPEVFGTKDEFVPLETIESLDPPDCTDCEQPLRLFHDPKVSEERFRERLSSDGYVSLIMDPQDQIQGFLYGYGTTLREQFESEWGNQYTYMADPPKEADRNFGDMLRNVREAFPRYDLGPDTEVFAWNCAAFTDKARGRSQIKRAAEGFFRSVPKSMWDRLDIGEVQRNSQFHQMLTRAGTVDVPGDFLGKQETLTGAPFGTYVRGFKRMWKLDI